MKKTGMRIALTAALLGMTAAQASEFDGGWIGGKVGSNSSSMTGVDTQRATGYGIEGGYNWNMGGFLLGVDGFADSNSKKTHNPGAVNYGSTVYGLDAKLGLPADKWLPYAKLGYAHTGGNGAASAIGGSAVHYGVGVEYKFAPNWSVLGEYTGGSGKSGATKLNNNNLSLGINYYFGGTAAAPAPVAAPVAVKEEPKAAPVAAPAPVKETWKTLLEDKPVRIEGANFDTNSAKLRSTSFQKLNEVVEFANKYKDARLDVTGHTDNRGSKAYNQKLSERRAASVKTYLVKKGVVASRITTKGYGFDQPVADNKTTEGRAQNRRVEIRSVLKEEKKVRVTE
ncbi:membrane protein [Ferrigenium kumadai]|uniref:Membrane protein n=1 Tax=Ferrigenium kumadai TaxID=1682490 RepID=A0AAN1SZQ5_9PROT|nr:OmpA family protein [Ferrigenium kumadai]BBI99616.1 membrane protein [Ferrigenium kumadai]